MLKQNGETKYKVKVYSFTNLFYVNPLIPESLSSILMSLILYIGHSSVRSHRSEYSNEIETIWNEFVYLFDERRKKIGCSHAKMYDVLSKEIKLSTGTLSGFYRHQKKPHVIS